MTADDREEVKPVLVPAFPIFETRKCLVDGTQFIGPCCPVCQDVSELRNKAASLGYELHRVTALEKQVKEGSK